MSPEKKYYHAFDKRYRKVHAEGVLWFKETPTPELVNWLKEYQISLAEEILDLGCGEGRDALYLASLGYQVTAVDVSQAAIKKCREIARQKNLKVNWLRADVLELSEKLSQKFKRVLAIGILQMLVADHHRQKFLKSLYSVLEAGGAGLLVNMGDGLHEEKEDPTRAFEEQERLHLKSKNSVKKVFLAATASRTVNWPHHKAELASAGFRLEKCFDTENEIYGQCMTVYLKK